MAHDSELEKTKRLAMVLKFLGVVVPTLIGSVGAWYTSRAQSRAELETGYKTLAEGVSDLKKAVDLLQDNERKTWKEKSEAEESKPEEVKPAPPARTSRRPRPITIGIGRVSAGGGGETSGALGAGAIGPPPPTPEKKAEEPPSFSVKQAPMDLEGALKEAK